MTVQESNLLINNSTLQQLLGELSEECKNITHLINQLQAPHLETEEKADILAELLAASLHLHIHCDEDFQELIREEIDQLPE